ncbi:MAG: 30S ribosomal protein S9 [Deltaproteobacteria bacterium]|nr:30S ribosomal protein S9 [Deltaproteobacteria bacterium]
MPADGKYAATGRRKSSVARVILSKGSGQMTINGRPAEQYMLTGRQLYVSRQPLELVGASAAFDVTVNVHGGGHTGQSGAVKHAVARALIKFDAELRAPLKKAGFLTRDARIVERKKYGQAKARKRFQFSKR